MSTLSLAFGRLQPVTELIDPFLLVFLGLLDLVVRHAIEPMRARPGSPSLTQATSMTLTIRIQFADRRTNAHS